VKSKLIVDRAYKNINEDGDIVICLVCKNKPNAEFVLEELKAERGKIDYKMEVDFKKYRSERTLLQNSALWFLLTKLSLAMNGSKDKTSVEETYCIILEEAQIESETVYAIPGAKENLRNAYRAIRKMDEVCLNGIDYDVYQCFKGSSRFDTAQMTELIQSVLLKLDELGVNDSELIKFRGDYAEYFTKN
jgi:hypothetical protein